MKRIYALFLILAITAVSVSAQDLQPDDSARLSELDDYWAEVSRCVKEGDFEGYVATFHKDAVFVTGPTNEAYPISQALARWKPDILRTKSGERKANVEFRFSRRLGDKTTAYETGIFFYSSVDAEGKKNTYYIHFEGLLVKRGAWIAMMEYQKSEGTQEEWNKLKKSKPRRKK